MTFNNTIFAEYFPAISNAYSKAWFDCSEPSIGTRIFSINTIIYSPKIITLEIRKYIVTKKKTFCKCNFFAPKPKLIELHTRKRSSFLDTVSLTSYCEFSIANAKKP